MRLDGGQRQKWNPTALMFVQLDTVWTTVVCDDEGIATQYHPM